MNDLSPVYCVTDGCRNHDRKVVIGRTNGTAADIFCGECRKWTPWRLELLLTRVDSARIMSLI